MRHLLLLVIAVTLLALPASGSAATIATPTEGATVTQGQNVYYDWAWDSDEYATSAIVLTQTADPNDPIWQFGPTIPANPGRVMYTDGGYPFIDSHATRPAKGLVAGTWYWRLCNKSINGEDDKCAYDAGVPPRALVVADGPDCNDGFDNDGDGRIDYPSDDDCPTLATTTESTPAPAPKPQSVPPTIKTVGKFVKHSYKVKRDFVYQYLRTHTDPCSGRKFTPTFASNLARSIAKQMKVGKPGPESPRFRASTPIGKAIRHMAANVGC